MKLDSKYFDSIRLAGRREKERPPTPEEVAERDAAGPCCQWKGCANTGRYRAPKGRGREGQYYVFCIDHVRQYNASYNYFDGMSDAEVEDFQKDAITGHRPTWKVGANAWAHGTRSGVNSAEHSGPARAQDPHGFFAWRAKKAREEPAENRRQLRPLEKKSLAAMHLDATATKAEIKARFKELVKRHHPDANGGDARSADTLREIIQAYNYLKQAGLA